MRGSELQSMTNSKERVNEKGPFGPFQIYCLDDYFLIISNVCSKLKALVVEPPERFS